MPPFFLRFFFRCCFDVSPPPLSHFPPFTQLAILSFRDSLCDHAFRLVSQLTRNFRQRATTPSCLTFPAPPSPRQTRPFFPFVRHDVFRQLFTFFFSILSPPPELSFFNRNAHFLSLFPLSPFTRYFLRACFSGLLCTSVILFWFHYLPGQPFGPCTNPSHRPSAGSFLMRATSM